MAKLAPPPPLAEICLSLISSHRVLILTGFPTQPRGRCETDGPPGGWALGKALTALGGEVVYGTDARFVSVLHNSGLLPVVDAQGARDLMRSGELSHVVAVERPGRTTDGRYYSMGGVDISDWVEPLDELLLPDGPLPSSGAAVGHGREAQCVVSVGIGDGGNEAGLGSLRGLVERSVPHGSRIATVVPADFALTAGVSNWGAWCVCAGLDVLRGGGTGAVAGGAADVQGRSVPRSAQALAQLRLGIAAGMVDGVSGRAEATVDGLPWEQHANVLDRLHEIVATARTMA